MVQARRTGAEGAAPSRGLGLSLPTVILLAAIAAVRVPLHDLGLVQEESANNALLVFAPPAIWVGVVLGRRVPNPLLALVVVGLAYGGMLAAGHQIFWQAAFGGGPPGLGGNLGGVLAPSVEAVVFRGFAFLSSLVTGTVVGTLAGTAAWTVERLRRS